jgi:DNA-binding CsgD family transcriptional regulator
MTKCYRDPEWLMLAQTLGLSQREAAEAAGASRNTIKYWEQKLGLDRGHDKTDPRLDNREWLKTKYWDEMTSSRDIADELGCSYMTVLRYLREHDIEVRARADYTDARLDDPEWMENAYWGDERRSTIDIADELGCSWGTVLCHLRDHGIDIRNLDDMDARLDDPEWMENAYWGDEPRTSHDIANELGCSYTTVLRHLSRLDIEVRSTVVQRLHCDLLGREVASRAELVFVRGLDEAGLLGDAEYEPGTVTGNGVTWEPDFRVGDWLVECKCGDIGAAMGLEPARQAPAMRACGSPVLVFGLGSDGEALPHDRFVLYEPGAVPDLTGWDP